VCIVLINKQVDHVLRAVVQQGTGGSGQNGATCSSGSSGTGGSSGGPRAAGPNSLASGGSRAALFMATFSYRYKVQCFSYMSKV
jgi:hypothetical protein